MEERAGSKCAISLSLSLKKKKESDRLKGKALINKEGSKSRILCSSFIILSIKADTEETKSNDGNIYMCV